MTLERVRRAVTAIPIVARPLLFLAIVPIAMHMLLFRGAPTSARFKVNEDRELTNPEDARRLITEHNDFRRKKLARCRIGFNPDAPVCRALADLGYIDPYKRMPTQRGSVALGHDLIRDGDEVTVAIARPQLRAIVKVTPPPQEQHHLRKTTRVDFTWSWEPTNRVGEKLGIEHHRRDMRGSVYLAPTRNEGWLVMDLRLHDASPDYLGRPL